MSYKPSTPLQDALDYACERGRAQGGWPLHRPELLTVKQSESTPAMLHLNGEGMDGVKRDALKLALTANCGNMTATAKKLKVARSTVYEMAKRYLLVVLLGTVAGCAAPEKPKSAIGQKLQAALPVRTEARSEVAPVVPRVGSLDWDNPPGVNLPVQFQATQNLRDWYVYCIAPAGATNIPMAVTNAQEFFRCRYVLPDGTFSEWNN